MLFLIDVNMSPQTSTTSVAAVIKFKVRTQFDLIAYEILVFDLLETLLSFML